MLFREEAETEESKKKSDDMRLTLAIQKSKEENATMPAAASVSILDLLATVLWVRSRRLRKYISG